MPTPATYLVTPIGSQVDRCSPVSSARDHEKNKTIKQYMCIHIYVCVYIYIYIYIYILLNDITAKAYGVESIADLLNMIKDPVFPSEGFRINVDNNDNSSNNHKRTNTNINKLVIMISIIINIEKNRGASALTELAEPCCWRTSF